MPQIVTIAPSTSWALGVEARRLTSRQNLISYSRECPLAYMNRRNASSAAALRTPSSECETEAPVEAPKKPARNYVPLNADRRKFLDSAVRVR